MKHLTTLLLFSYFPILLFSQTDVTSTYMENPDFEMRYAAWHNEGATKGAVGGFTHQVNSSFGSKANTVYMEKWVSAGSKVSDCNIKQKLFLPEGTYQLTVAAMNTQNGTAASGAYLYAGASSAEVGDEADYSVTFSVADQPVVVGFKTVSCTGNWVCLDNFRLYKLDDDAEAIALQRTADEEEYATLKANIEAAEASGATKPTVVTNPYVATGSTIALGRSTITTNGATILERGFCYGTEPEPTVMDNRTTDYFTNNGYIYRMENLTPATIYYVRAYAMTSDYAVAYGDEVKVATKLKGSVSYWYNSGGSDEENYRIRSAIEETVWMYNNLSYITGFSISCTYGASTATADCSYGGSMRVGPVTSYQQTGTLLHETNHGVGVGTSSEWYSNANYRASTTYGKWLGPVANELLQFLQNDDAAFMTGDGTHMWGTTTSSITMKSYGINGASEDSYSPSDQLLYWGNIMLTHALHIDGLKCSSSVGWAVPTYVFEQRDTTKYYIKCEDSDYGTGTYLTHTNTGTLKSVAISNEEAQADDAYAWYITYNAKTGYYTFTNVGSGRVIGLSSSALKAVTSSAASIHLFPSKEKVTMGDYSKHSYWITASKGSYALKGGSSACSSTPFSYADGTEAQRLLFLSADEMNAYDAGQASTLLSELTELIDNVRAVSAVAHTTTEEGIDEALEETLSTIESEMDSYGTTQISTAISNVEAALQTFLANAKEEDESDLFDLTFLLTTTTVTSSTDGWTGAASCSSDV